MPPSYARGRQRQRWLVIAAEPDADCRRASIFREGHCHAIDFICAIIRIVAADVEVITTALPLIYFRAAPEPLPAGIEPY
jgi:hypothetical protein